MSDPGLGRPRFALSEANPETLTFLQPEIRSRSRLISRPETWVRRQQDGGAGVAFRTHLALPAAPR